jgi:hypothetical protein
MGLARGGGAGESAGWVRWCGGRGGGLRWGCRGVVVVVGVGLGWGSWLVGGRAVVVEGLVLGWLREGWLVVVEDGVVWGCLNEGFIEG